MRKQRLRGVEITGFKSHSLDVGAELGWLGVWLPPALHPGCSLPSLTSASVIIRGFPGGSEGKESACNARDLCSLPGLGRFPGEGNGYPLQYSGLKNSRGCIPWGCRVDTIEQLITFRSFRAFVDSLTWADTWNSLPYNTSKGLNLSLLLGATDP